MPIEPIRMIRNTFAHDLTIISFNEARQTKPDDFKVLYDKIHTFGIWSLNGSNADDDKETFKRLVFLITLALRIYSKHLDIVQKHIRMDENLVKIIQKTK